MASTFQQTHFPPLFDATETDLDSDISTFFFPSIEFEGGGGWVGVPAGVIYCFGGYFMGRVVEDRFHSSSLCFGRKQTTGSHSWILQQNGGNPGGLPSLAPATHGATECQLRDQRRAEKEGGGWGGC